MPLLFPFALCIELLDAESIADLHETPVVDVKDRISGDGGSLGFFVHLLKERQSKHRANKRCSPFVVLVLVALLLLHQSNSSRITLLHIPKYRRIIPSQSWVISWMSGGMDVCAGVYWKGLRSTKWLLSLWWCWWSWW